MLWGDSTNTKTKCRVSWSRSKTCTTASSHSASSTIMRISGARACSCRSNMITTRRTICYSLDTSKWSKIRKKSLNGSRSPRPSWVITVRIRYICYSQLLPLAALQRDIITWLPSISEGSFRWITWRVSTTLTRRERGFVPNCYSWYLTRRVFFRFKNSWISLSFRARSRSSRKREKRSLKIRWHSLR